MTLFRRDDLAQIAGMNPRLLAAFEEQASAVEQASNGVADTQALKDATVIVLSANGDFTNERVLQIGDGIAIEITDSTVTLSVKDVARTEDYSATLIPPADVVLFLPPSGRLLSNTDFANLNDYASDALASAGGVQLGGLYLNSGTVHVRIT